MGRINREILALATPAIISNITTPLLGLVDTAITGHLGAATYIAAIALGSSMFVITYWLFNFLQMGTSGLTAQQYGKGVPTDMVLWRAFAVAAAISLALIALSPLTTPLLLWFLDADQSTTAFAALYYQIVIFGAPAVLGTYALSGWLLGMQDTKTPMWIAIVTNVSNITISLTLVFGFGMKIAGVAIGTLSAQWIGIIVGLALMRKKHRAALSSALSASALFDRQALRRFFSVNSNLFFRMICIGSVTIWFTRSGASMGPTVLAANAVLLQLFVLFSFFMDGFAFAGEAMSGKYYGKGDSRMLVATIKGIMAWGAVLAAIFTLAYALFGNWFIMMLTDDQGVVEVAKEYMPWAIFVPIAGVLAFAWDGIFVGLTKTRQMFASMATATAAYFILYFICTPSLANHGLWLAFLAYLILRGSIQSVQAIHIIKSASKQ